MRRAEPRLLLTCEHAGRHVPHSHARLFRGREALRARSYLALEIEVSQALVATAARRARTAATVTRTLREALARG